MSLRDEIQQRMSDTITAETDRMIYQSSYISQTPIDPNVSLTVDKVLRIAKQMLETFDFVPRMYFVMANTRFEASRYVDELNALLLPDDPLAPVFVYRLSWTYVERPEQLKGLTKKSVIIYLNTPHGWSAWQEWAASKYLENSLNRGCELYIDMQQGEES